MTDRSEFHWVEYRKLAPWLRNAPGVSEDLVGAAEDENGEYRLAAWCRYSDGEPEITIGVFNNDNMIRATTDDTHDWPIVGELFPRELWPSEMYVGVHGPAEHEAPGDLRDILNMCIHEYESQIGSEIAGQLYEIARDLGYRPQLTDWMGGPEGTDAINGIILGEDRNDHVCELYVFKAKEIVLADPDGEVLYSWRYHDDTLTEAVNKLVACTTEFLFGNHVKDATLASELVELANEYGCSVMAAPSLYWYDKPHGMRNDRRPMTIYVTPDDVPLVPQEVHIIASHGHMLRLTRHDKHTYVDTGEGWQEHPDELDTWLPGLLHELGVEPIDQEN